MGGKNVGAGSPQVDHQGYLQDGGSCMSSKFWVLRSQPQPKLIVFWKESLVLDGWAVCSIEKESVGLNQPLGFRENLRAEACGAGAPRSGWRLRLFVSRLG